MLETGKRSPERPCVLHWKKNKYENWWNVHNIESGHMEPLDAEKFDFIEAIDEENHDTVETDTYAVNVSRYRHG